jgi:Lon protease-like protein
MNRKRIPLFPLEVVLFPGIPLPLHIFEPRYKLMIRHCLEQRQEFGVVLARSKGVAPVGCTAEIIEVVKEYPDGQMDIITVGDQVFRMIKLVSEKSYHEADVEFLPERESTGAESSSDSDDLLRAYEKCHELVYGRPPEADDRDDSASLAYHIAGDLPLDLEKKQSLLELRDEGQRRARLLDDLKELLPLLSKKYSVREKARGNGHASL